MPYMKSRDVADLLGCPYYRLTDLLRSRKIPRPQKDSSGDYVWVDQDVTRARQALQECRQRKVVRA
jgi:hypothetical protein